MSKYYSNNYSNDYNITSISSFLTLTNLIVSGVKVDLIREKVLNIFPLETETEGGRQMQICGAGNIISLQCRGEMLTGSNSSKLGAP